jgi:hypothetical protein
MLRYCSAIYSQAVIVKTLIQASAKDARNEADEELVV